MVDLENVISVARGVYATPKKQYLEECRANIFKMKREIAQLEQEKTFLQPGSFDFLRCQKRIARRYSIMKDCKQAIFFTEIQMNTQPHARFRGL